jgi:hypothetical protein
VAVEHKEVVFLNDYRWQAKQIAWADFLLLLEGAPVHIAAPKTSREKDIFFDKDVPIFATAHDRVRFASDYHSSSKQIDEEQEMMDVRWKIFDLKHQIPVRHDIPSCAKCFADLVLTEVH